MLKFINSLISFNNSNKLKKYISELEIETDAAELTGPFLLENYAIKHHASFKDILCRTYNKVNLTIVRCFALICEDGAFETRDNSRIDLGINPYSHRIELAVIKDKNDLYFDVKGVDGFILMNDNDTKRIKDLVVRFPPTAQELRYAIIK